MVRVVRQLEAARLEKPAARPATMLGRARERLQQPAVFPHLHAAVVGRLKQGQRFQRRRGHRNTQLCGGQRAAGERHAAADHGARPGHPGGLADEHRHFWRGDGAEQEHGGGTGRAEGLLAHLAQQVAHVHGHVAKVDVHRTGREAFVAHGAVVRHVFELFPMLE